MFWMNVTRIFFKTEILRDFLCTLKAGIFSLKKVFSPFKMTGFLKDTSLHLCYHWFVHYNSVKSVQVQSFFKVKISSNVALESTSINFILFRIYYLFNQFIKNKPVICQWKKWAAIDSSIEALTFKKKIIYTTFLFLNFYKKKLCCLGIYVN
jgi:hypothetical protein